MPLAAMDRFLPDRATHAEALSSLFQAVDTSKDMVISREEWEAAFDVVDKNHDGTVSRKEFYMHQGQTHLFDTVAGSHKAAITRKTWCGAFDTLDTDKDGTISFKEWENMGVSSWEVKQTVHIFAEPETTSRQVGNKVVGDIIRGRLEGIWLVLTDEPGFMLSSTVGSAELSTKTLRELKLMASECELEERMIDTIDEAPNPKQRAIFLIEEQQKRKAAKEKKAAAEIRKKAEKDLAERVYKLRGLRAMNLKELKGQARQMSISEEMIAKMDDESDPKKALLKLLEEKI